MSDLCLTVQILAGTSVAKAAEQMQRLADWTGVDVSADFNEVKLTALVGGTGSYLEARYHIAAAIKTPPYGLRMAFSR